MAIANLNKILQAKGMQIERNSEKKEDKQNDENVKEILGLIFQYLKQNDSKYSDLLRAVMDNQKLLMAKLEEIKKELEE